MQRIQKTDLSCYSKCVYNCVLFQACFICTYSSLRKVTRTPLFQVQQLTRMTWCFPGWRKPLWTAGCSSPTQAQAAPDTSAAYWLVGTSQSPPCTALQSPRRAQENSSTSKISLAHLGWDHQESNLQGKVLRSIMAVMVQGLPGWRAAPTSPERQQIFLASGPWPTPISPGGKTLMKHVSSQNLFKMSLRTLHKINGLRNLRSFQGRKFPWTNFCSGTIVISPSRALLTVTAEVGYCKIAAWKNDLVLLNSFCKSSEYKVQDF